MARSCPTRLYWPGHSSPGQYTSLPGAAIGAISGLLADTAPWTGERSSGVTLETLNTGERWRITIERITPEVH